ncbi:acyl-coenzyme A thioesterase THEM4-like [Branchiostoma lanceolatum]|uniref:acyl-coenzyme A thioesterase THEM4-like n=1 Tax=Branchiostoma lanceolatum TaxID=7740 RepID=UPI00345435B8
MALRNCTLLSKRAINFFSRAKPEIISHPCRLLHTEFAKVTQVQQGGSPRFIGVSSGFLNSGCSFSRRGFATVMAEGKDEQHSGKTKQEDASVDAAWPNEAWSDVAKEIFHQLNAGTENGDWKRHPGYLRTGERRLYSRNISEQGKGFEYAIFLNKKEQRATCVCQFGPYLQGPPGHVHGGALATMLDAVIGTCVHDALEGFWLTANLNINYKKPVPLGSTALFHAKVDRQDDRKGYLSAYVTSADGQTTLCDATSLFIKLSREKMEKAKKYLPQESQSNTTAKEGE